MRWTYLKLISWDRRWSQNSPEDHIRCYAVLCSASAGSQAELVRNICELSRHKIEICVAWFDLGHTGSLQIHLCLRPLQNIYLVDPCRFSRLPLSGSLCKLTYRLREACSVNSRHYGTDTARVSCYRIITFLSLCGELVSGDYKSTKTLTVSVYALRYDCVIRVFLVVRSGLVAQ